MVVYTRQVVLIVFAFLSVAAAAQHERDNWFFASYAGLTFKNGNVSINNSNNNLLYNGSSCVSDRVTGELLFYTDGVKVWNKNHLPMDGGANIVTLTSMQNVYPVIITSYPGQPEKYYIFSKINNNNNSKITYAIADMAANNGMGKVISSNNLLANLGKIGGGGLAAVHNKCMDGIWLIHAQKKNNVDSFKCFKITADSINKTPVESTYTYPPSYSGDSHWIKTNRAGNVIYSGGSYSGNLSSISSFDQYTGKVSNNTILPVVGDFEYPQGGEFSTDGTKLYVSFENTNYESIIVQYSGLNFSTANIIAKTKDTSFNDLLRGSDNRIYISSSGISADPLPDIDVIEIPDADAQNCNFTKDFIIMPDGRGINYVFPTFSNAEMPAVITTNTSGSSIGDICIYDTAKINMTENPAIDSISWDFGDSLVTTDTSSRYKNTYKYSDTGVKKITANWYVCGKKHTSTQQIQVLPPPQLSLGPDTVFCYKDSVKLTALSNYKNLNWSTGQTTNFITTAKVGNYWVKASNGTCITYDTINVKQRPPILVELGGDYAICDDDNELVKLDAGKGYEHYKWTPTGDTTQWIIVNKTGDYFVIVEDFRGCKGNDGTRVNRFCDFVFYIPNVFTPNDDGLNDVFAPVFSDIYNFSIEIYNRWGEQVFVSDNPARGWDGTYKGNPCADGSYIWKLRFRGNQNKILRNYNYKGVVYLLR